MSKPGASVGHIAAGVCAAMLSVVVVAADVGSGDTSEFRELTIRDLGAEKAIETAAPAPGTIVVVAAQLTDNGDGDGIADTNETVQMRLTLYNRMGFDVTGLVVTLATGDAKIACIPEATIVVGDLGDRETLTTTGAFTFLVGEVDRVSVDEEFSVQFDVEMSADQFDALPVDPTGRSLWPPQRVVIDLDLDLSGGSGPTTFFEGFEGGFGTFTTMHLDEHLNTYEASDGYRCQYNDPDWERSNWQGNPAPGCHLIPPGAPDAFYFHITAERAFSGGQALHYGVYLSEALGFTTPVAQLEALASSEPVSLSWGHVCSTTRTTPCAGDTDCPVDETCVGVSPTLSIKHQISQLDHRYISGGADGLRGVDRAVLHAQLADAGGAPIGNWIKIYPFTNAYDTQDNNTFFNCKFDPTDDGNDEGSFFDPTDPQRRYGPSSTCVPERTFVHQGDTDAPFDPLNIGDASDGPGLEGELGHGTWVESAFDLSRFAGRRLRLRFLETGIAVGDVGTWQQAFSFNPTPLDDGWFIDDVTITDTLTTPATVTVDLKENLDLKQDFDLDGVGAVCDCNSDDETAWDLPGAAQDLLLDHAGGTTGTTTLSWSAPAYLGGTAVLYDTLRATNPADFVNTGSCLEAGDGSDTQAQDTTHPAEGELHSFLVRAKHSCGAGPIGASSSGVDRPAIGCP